MSSIVHACKRTSMTYCRICVKIEAKRKKAKKEKAKKMQVDQLKDDGIYCILDYC